jgi:hypothetical protein
VSFAGNAANIKAANQLVFRMCSETWGASDLAVMWMRGDVKSLAWQEIDRLAILISYDAMSRENYTGVRRVT